jgi:hypothetical protein
LGLGRKQVASLFLRVVGLALLVAGLVLLVEQVLDKRQTFVHRVDKFEVHLR